MMLVKLVLVIATYTQHEVGLFITACHNIRSVIISNWDEDN